MDADKIDASCVVCLSARKNTALLPCKHVATCEACTKKLLALSTQPQCPVCRAVITDCLFGMYI
eukprot:6152622-Pyramimonas_sp.AAC.1